MRSRLIACGLAVALGLAIGLALLPGAARADDSLYRAFGGRDGLDLIVRDAIALWQVNPRVKDDFDNINLDRLRIRIVDQLCELTGGPCKYTGRNMHASHKGLHLNSVKFNAVAEDLQRAMDKAAIPFRTQNRLIALLAPMRRDIVTR
ncbi:MAG: group 1 truncated hemoglobin [Rhodospirillales bacterium]